MASGQQKAQDDDFKQIVRRGQLNRIKVTKGVGCGKSALIQKTCTQESAHHFRR